MNNFSSNVKAEPNNEISFSELLGVLIKWKWLVIISSAVCLLAGMVFIKSTPSIYEASVALRIGQYRDTLEQPTFLENPVDLLARLSVKEGVTAALQAGSSNIVTVSVATNHAEEAKGRLNEIINEIISSHLEIYEDNLSAVMERLERLRDQKRILEEELAVVTPLIEKIRIQEPVQASVLILQRMALAQTMYQIDTNSLRLKQQIITPQARPSELLGQIIGPTKVDKPKKSIAFLVLVVGFGLMGSIMLAFLIEFMKNKK